VDFSISGNEVTFANGPDWAEVVEEDVPVAAGAARPRTVAVWAGGPLRGQPPSQETTRWTSHRFVRLRGSPPSSFPTTPPPSRSLRRCAFGRARRDHYARMYDTDPEGTKHLLTASAEDGGLAPGAVPRQEVGATSEADSQGQQGTGLFPQLNQRLEA
jgi:hypothetical protein